MMPSYSKSRWTPIFFVAYMSVVFYFLTNLITAVVYASFTIHEKDKIKKLLLHRREAAQMAYRALTERWPLTIDHFFELIRYLDSSKSRLPFEFAIV
jgi:two pore calcium channel protein 1